MVTKKKGNTLEEREKKLKEQLAKIEVKRNFIKAKEEYKKAMGKK